jgi:Asp-tRNA(Asn)/Glu-tRNA(Gln) amidotransferase A subunit family amidase
MSLSRSLFFSLLFVLNSTSGSPANIPPTPSPQFQVVETTIAETQAAIRSGKVTCRQIVEMYLARIRTYDQTTRLNSVVVLNPSALADADALDQEFARTHMLRPLQGVAVVVKDNYDTKGLQTADGLLALKGFLPAEDAFMVKRLRDAGAIILFKSNMAEFAFSPVMTESSIDGVTRNPYDLNRVPAGSSGGTAAAVAANLAEVGLGTDTGDSIRGPSSHNDLVGIRPTIGLTSRDGIVPDNIKSDMGGPLARTVADAATVLSVVAGYDPADPITRESDGKVEKDYTRFLDKNGLKGARIGVLRRFVDTPTTDPEIKALTDRVVADMKAQGAEVVDFDIPNYEAVSRSRGGGCSNELQIDIDEYMAAHGQNAPYKTLKEIYESGLYLPSSYLRLMSIFDPDAAAAYRKANPTMFQDAGSGGGGGGGTGYGATARGASASTGLCLDVYHDPRRVAFRDSVVSAMDAAKIDAFIYPTWSNPPRLVGDLRSPAGNNSGLIAPPTGLPCITVPMGFTHGDLPAGISILGRSFSEPTLFKLAYAYEQATRYRRPPAAFAPLKSKATSSVVSKE